MQTTPHRSAVLSTKPIHSAIASPQSMPSWLPDTKFSDSSLLEHDPSGTPLDNGYVLEGPRRLKFVKFLGAGAFGWVFLAEDLDWAGPRSMSTGHLEDLPRSKDLSLSMETARDFPRSSFSYPSSATVAKNGGSSSSDIIAPFSHRYYAVKCLDNNTVTHDRRQREIRNHLAVQGHRGIVELYAVVHEEGWTFLILEYAEEGDMLRSMAKQNTYAVCDLRLGEVFGQVVDAVQHCHRKGVYHRDLKPENILCRNGGSDVVLGDFGLSTTTRMSTSFGCGSAYYMSPECIGQGYLAHSLLPPAGWEPQLFDTSRNDVWCLGVILCNMICGLAPWEKARESDAEFMRFLRHPLLLRQSLPISWRAFSLFLQIFDPNPETRITLETLKDRIHDIGTFRMTPWEIEASAPEIRRAAEAWLPDTNQPRSQWTRYETYPEHLDSPRSCVPHPPSSGDSRDRVRSEDIVPCLDPCSEDERSLGISLVTPEALVGNPALDEGCIPELDLADGLYAWNAELDLSSS